MYRLCAPLLALAAVTAVAPSPAGAAESGAEPIGAEPIGVFDFVRYNEFNDIKISPDGRFLAATKPEEGTTVLAVLDRENKELLSAARFRFEEHVGAFAWAGDERLVFTSAKAAGRLVAPSARGELHFMDADGRNKKSYGGPRNARYMEILDPLPDDPGQVLATSYTYTAHSEGADIWAYRIDTQSVKVRRIVRAPLTMADLIVDNAGSVRLSVGSREDLNEQVHLRGADGEWQLVHDKHRSGRRMNPLGFTADNSGFYAALSEDEGPDALYLIKGSEQRRIYRDEVSDPIGLLWSVDFRRPLGVVNMPGRPAVTLFGGDDSDKDLMKSLFAAFPGETVRVTSSTRDGKMFVFVVSSDRNPGRFYLFNRDTGKATFLLARRSWIDPARMAEMKPITVTARDGLELQGFLTLPPGSDGKNLPLVVNPHGGPHGPFDIWSYSPEVQLMASRGYAVLQINFRGSGGYGLKFEQMGYREWGGKMQDDVTDATRWAIAQGIADADRICIAGASYGAYAALMGAAKEPDLYVCAVGFVGVYDLPMMFKEGDIPEMKSGQNFLKMVLSEDRSEQARRSPSYLAEHIRIPVFIAAGKEDERAPPEQSEAMRDALVKAGNAPQWLMQEGEGHGFYLEKNNLNYYTQVLAFLDRHLKNRRDVGAPIPISAD